MRLSLGFLRRSPRDRSISKRCASESGSIRRGACDFFDALVALGLLERDPAGRYANTPETGIYLDRSKPTYMGGELDYLNARIY